MKAFPSPHDPKTGTMQLGMDLRDYFAAMAMQALLSSDGWTEEAGFEATAHIAYKQADAMMKARDE